jgi:hypothetical protein
MICSVDWQIQRQRHHRNQSTSAQGDDKYAVRFNFYSKDSQWLEGKLTLTWNDIIALVGPIILDEASEPRIKDKLIELIMNRVRKDIFTVTIIDEDLQQIKIQLRALGIIVTRTDKSRVGGPVYWKLTPYGDSVMTKTAAIPKPQNS